MYAIKTRRILQRGSIHRAPHVACRMSHVACRMSHVACRMSHVARRMSHVACRMSHVACRMSHVACHISHVACRMSHIAYRISHVAHRGRTAVIQYRLHRCVNSILICFILLPQSRAYPRCDIHSEHRHCPQARLSAFQYSLYPLRLSAA